jgi:hypothetical protein
MQLPPPREVPPDLPGISAEPVVDAVTGQATVTAELPSEPIAMPVIVAPVAPAPRVGTAAAPRVPEPNAARPNPSAFGTGNGVPPESFRVGYGNYLRTAGVGRMMAIALPGVIGLLFLTGAGGVLGYRQARVGRDVRADSTARFVG